MKGLLAFFIRLALILILAFCLMGTLLLYLSSYEELTAALFNQVGQSGKLEKFRTLLLTRERFYILRLIACAATALTVAAVLWLWRKAEHAAHLLGRANNYFGSRLRRLGSFWQSLPPVSKYITLALFALIFLSRLYFLFRFPFHVDERFTYLYFVHKGLAVSLAYYPGPNNHILYTLICNFFHLFIEDPVMVMKIPALLIGLVLSVSFWLVVSRYVTYPVALVAAALFSFAEPVFYYSLQGRGYALLMLFVLLATHSALNIVRQVKFSFPAYFWFWLSCTLGFYTIPIFLYPFMSLVAFICFHVLLRRKYSSFKYLIFTSAAVALSAFLLYLPVIIFNGWNALAGNAWVSPVPWQEYILLFPQHVWELASGLWGILPMGKWLSIISVILCLVVVCSRQATPSVRQWMWLYLINLAIILGISFFQRLLPPLRVVFYLNIYQYVVLILGCTELVKLFHKLQDLPARGSNNGPGSLPLVKRVTRIMIAACISLLFAATNIYNFNALTSPDAYTIYDSFDATAQWLYHHNANNIYANEYDYSLCIRFLYETNGREVSIDTNQPEAGREYRYLVIHPSRPYPAQIALSQYRQVYKDREAIIYKILQK
jgi:hypothetical protein